ncbi:acyltransferase [Lactobacillus agrestimuris]|uniref:acyltransferase n=1 Tax=Lactobacillus agrestimuris TaxID=2941328 RepID=UPI00204388D2|nr:acyltransferase [Lactobacillus agrestimuris]
MKKRLSNLELLRIVSMFLIVLGHTTWQTKFSYSTMPLAHKVSIQSLWIGGEMGVWAFTLISAYFLSTSNFKRRALKNIWGLTLFYSIAIYLILVFTNTAPLNFKFSLKSFLPVLTGNYWYVSAYIGMYILIPFSNKLIREMNKKEYNIFIIILFVMLSLLPYLKNITVVTNNNSIFNLLYIYFIGGYIKKYKEDFSKANMKYYILTFILSVILMILSITILDIIRPKSWSAFLTTSSPLEAIAGISLFLIFKNIDIKHSKFINTIAASTFAVYLIHCQTVFFPILWGKIIRAQQYENSSYIIIYEILIAIIIYIVATIIDLIRREIVGLFKTQVMKRD